MGNEGSQHSKIEIQNEAVEVTTNWSLYNAKDTDRHANLSAFVGETKTGENKPIPLEILAKNLMIHRHPCILRYISSWKRINKFYLITEEVEPLSVVLSNQTTLEICVGLYSVLTGVIFLHEKAKSSHNNICCASIYVTPDRVWKLGGLEFLKKVSDVSPDYLKKMRVHRYEKAVPPEEDSLLPNAKVNAEAVDKYAFGILVEELLKKKLNDEIPCLADFLDFCKKKLQNSNPSERPDLNEVLSHEFFNHEFIKISRFLFDLPLKSFVEKEQFFSEVTEQLFLLPENVVGSQLSSLLLSRVVLLDSTAQKHLLPVILQPRTGDEEDKSGLFSELVFKQYIIPKLLQIFCVRDCQIRLILLNHFQLFCDSFTTEQLKEQILPELLVGIKDTNDQLVSMTLKALSYLVEILGGATVIGGKRGRLFTDGRPKSQSVMSPKSNKPEIKDKVGLTPSKSNRFYKNDLPERPSPDGGEDSASSPTVFEGEVDTETWSDWDVPGEKDPKETTTKAIELTSSQSLPNASKSEERINPTNSLADITALDIKSNSDQSKVLSEIDFFRDMEPVISKTQVLSIKSSKTKFDIDSDEMGSNWEGWEEDWELNEVS